MAWIWFCPVSLVLIKFTGKKERANERREETRK
jgi:hypothetical protein